MMPATFTPSPPPSLRRPPPAAPQREGGQADERPDQADSRAEGARTAGERGRQAGRGAGAGVGRALGAVAVEDVDVGQGPCPDDDVAPRVDAVRLGVAPLAADLAELVGARLQAAEAEQAVGV